nr:hypothetical protein [Tanacetum cinerariifolium]
MNPQETQQVIAHDEKWVPSIERLKISSTNVRLETTVHEKEETFQVVIDVIKNSMSKTQILMNSFWPTRSVLSMLKSLERLLISLRVEGEEFTEVQDDNASLTILVDLCYKGTLNKYTNIVKSQGKKTEDNPVADVDVSKEFDSKSARKRTAIRIVVKKKVTISAADNIILDPNVTLALGKSTSLTKAVEEEASRQVHATHARIMTESIPKPARRRPSGIAFRYTSQVLKKVSFDLSQKLKGVQSLNPEEKDAADIMKALKESKNTSRRQPGTGGSSEGTGSITRIPNEFKVISTTSSEGTGTKPGVLNEEKVTSIENVIL